LLWALRVAVLSRLPPNACIHDTLSAASSVAVALVGGSGTAALAAVLDGRPYGE